MGKKLTAEEIGQLIIKNPSRGFDQCSKCQGIEPCGTMTFRDEESPDFDLVCTECAIAAEANAKINKMNKDNLKTYISKLVEEAVGDIFEEVHSTAMTTSGDITPAQQLELEEIQDKLKALVHIQVVQNLAPEVNACSNCRFDMGPGYENCGASEDGVCPECGTDNTPEKQWNVPILRKSYSHTVMAVSARNEEEAIALAIDEAGDESFSENSADYEAPDGAMEIKDSNK